MCINQCILVWEFSQVCKVFKVLISKTLEKLLIK
jgi:hypothetical protein